MNIFDLMYKQFKFKQKEIILFEAFSGIGSQQKALNKLAEEYNFKLKIAGISEIDTAAIQSYESIHGAVKNYGSITEIKTIPKVDIFTYSFPCQDISRAGKQKGFAKGSGTRSGLLWEVERILLNQAKEEKLPKVLLMENVKALAGHNFNQDFIDWQMQLEKLGYKNYWRILNAKHYGVPQTRERIIMISIQGEYSYNFPESIPLEKDLKDYLDKEVPEKYYINQNIYDRLVVKKETNHLKVLNNTKKGYLIAEPYDGIILNHLTGGGYKGNGARGRIQKKMAPTLLTQKEVGVIESDLRIRQLTAREKWKLMGFNDEEYNKVAAVTKETQLLKQAGNSIVVDLLYYVFKQLF